MMLQNSTVVKSFFGLKLRKITGTMDTYMDTNEKEATALIL